MNNLCGLFFIFLYLPFGILVFLLHIFPMVCCIYFCIYSFSLQISFFPSQTQPYDCSLDSNYCYFLIYSNNILLKSLMSPILPANPHIQYNSRYYCHPNQLSPPQRVYFFLLSFCKYPRRYIMYTLTISKHTWYLLMFQIRLSQHSITNWTFFITLQHSARHSILLIIYNTQYMIAYI